MRIPLNLPPVPEVLLKLRAELASEKLNLTGVIEVLSRDPALVAAVLRTVNAPYYGLARTVEDVGVAVAYLGLRRVMAIVQVATLAKSLKASPARVRAHWTHAELVESTARTLARRYAREFDVATPWTPALLHDIGQLLRATLFPQETDRVESYMRQHGVTTLEAEHALGLPTHCELGSLLARHWRLTPLTVEVIAHHHNPEEVDRRNPAVSSATRLVHHAGLIVALARHPNAEERAPQVAERAGLTNGEVLELLAAIQRQTELVGTTWGPA